MPLSDYNIISSKKVKYNRNHIVYKKKRLIIKDKSLGKRLQCLLMKKFDARYGQEFYYLAFSEENIFEEAKSVSVSDFGYYMISVPEIVADYNITKDVNVKLELEEEDELITVYKVVV